MSIDASRPFILIVPPEILISLAAQRVKSWSPEPLFILMVPLVIVIPSFMAFNDLPFISIEASAIVMFPCAATSSLMLTFPLSVKSLVCINLLTFNPAPWATFTLPKRPSEGLSYVKVPLSTLKEAKLEIPPEIAWLKEWSASKVKWEPETLPLIFEAEFWNEIFPLPEIFVFNCPDKSIWASSPDIVISPEVKLALSLTVRVPFVKSIFPVMRLFPVAVICAPSPLIITLEALPSTSWSLLLLMSRAEFSFKSKLPPVILTLPLFSFRISI